MMTFRKTLDKQMTGQCNETAVLKTPKITAGQHLPCTPHLPGSQHGSLLAHEGGCSSAFPHPPHIHTWVPWVPLGLCPSQEHKEGEWRRMEAASGKRKAAML